MECAKCKLFNPTRYLNDLKRCNIETVEHLERVLNEDLDCEQWRLLCQKFNTNAGGIVRAIASALGIFPQKKKP